MFVLFLVVVVQLLSHVQFCDPIDCSSPGSSVHGISQAIILQWVAISFSRGASQPRDRTLISCVSCTAGGFFTAELPGKLFYLGSVQFSHSVVSNSLQPHEPQQARPPCSPPKSQSSPVMPKSRNLPMTTREPVSDAKAREFLLPSLSWGSHRY